jgi:hypothetical protein
MPYGIYIRLGHMASRLVIVLFLFLHYKGEYSTHRMSNLNKFKDSYQVLKKI